MNPIYIFNEDKKVFAYNFKELMKESNMTISKLSEITGFEIITIKKWRAGDRMPSLESLKILAAAFNTTVQKIYLPHSYYRKDFLPKFQQFLNHEIIILPIDYEELINLVDYNCYLIQKMIFSFLSEKELTDLTSIYRYYNITDYGKELLNLGKDLSFDNFYNKSKEYIINKYGISLPYTITLEQRLELIRTYNKVFKLMFVSEDVKLV